MNKNFGQLQVGDKVYLYNSIERIVLPYTIKHKVIDNEKISFTLDGTREQLKVPSCNLRFSGIGKHTYSDKNLLLKDLLVELKLIRIAINKYQKINDIKNMTSTIKTARRIYYAIQSIRYENIHQS